MALEEYHRIANEGICWQDYSTCCEADIAPVFGALTEEILLENHQDCATGITAQTLSRVSGEIVEILHTLPQPEALRTTYQRLGVKSTLEDICVSSRKAAQLLTYSPWVRNRVTLMRLRKCIKVM